MIFKNHLNRISEYTQEINTFPPLLSLFLSTLFVMGITT